MWPLKLQKRTESASTVLGAVKKELAESRPSIIALICLNFFLIEAKLTVPLSSLLGFPLPFLFIPRIVRMLVLKPWNRPRKVCVLG